MLYEVEMYQGNNDNDNVNKYLDNLNQLDEELWKRVTEYLRMIKDSQNHTGRYWEYIEGGIIEIKHRSGNIRSRIYGCFNGKQKIMLLNGSIKTGKKQQQKDIKRARVLKIELNE